jgi:hypothetical protein
MKDRMDRSHKGWPALAVAAVLVGLMGAGCARATATGSSGGTSGGTTVVLHYSDLGRTVGLNVGDTIVVDLSKPSSQLEWVLTRYPTNVLRPFGPTASSQFRFEATAAGSGQVLIQDSIPCPGATGTPRACPFANGQKPTVPPAGENLMIRPFSVTVRVS